MTAPRALVAGVLIVALGGTASRIVHVKLVHHRVASFRRQDVACLRWNESARIIGYGETQHWHDLPNGAQDVRRIPDRWASLYRTQGWYPGAHGHVARPPYC